MLGMLNTLPLSLLGYAVENRLIFFLASLHYRHRSILRGELRGVTGAKGLRLHQNPVRWDGGVGATGMGLRPHGILSPP